MDESGVYTETDLKPFQSRLDELKMIIIRDEDKEIAAKKEAEVDGVPDEELHPEGLTKLLLRKWEECSAFSMLCIPVTSGAFNNLALLGQYILIVFDFFLGGWGKPKDKMLKSLLASLSVLSVELVPIHQRLITIRRQLAAMAARKPTTAELTSVQDELRKIDSKRIDGKFLGPGGASVPEGQAILTGLLEENFEICQEIGARKEDVSPTLQPIYERLCDLKAALERLTLTHRWTLRETVRFFSSFPSTLISSPHLPARLSLQDLYNFQVSLQELDAMRVDGKFVDAEGNKPEGQLVSKTKTRTDPFANQVSKAVGFYSQKELGELMRNFQHKRYYITCYEDVTD
jgi:hypothetical protein